MDSVKNDSSDLFLKGIPMFWVAMVLLILAILSGALGFVFFIGKVLLFVFLVLFILTLMLGRTIFI